MIRFFLVGHEFEYEVRNIYRIFDLNSDIEIIYKDFENYNCDNYLTDTNDLIVFTELSDKENFYIGTAKLYKNNQLINQISINSKDIVLEKNDERKLKKTIIKKALYNLLSDYFGINAEYGFLTGIRPNKILSLALHNGLTNNDANKILKETYEVSDEKIKLLNDVYKKQISYIDEKENSQNYNIYIGIPFCPTKCIYCSFVSFTNYTQVILDNYIKTLTYELEETIKLAIENGLKLNTIYVGGGTPSVLSCDNINSIFATISKYYDLSKINEITFEAGRPDTITYQKLNCLKNNHVTRISINPQTMNDDTLKTISRKHTVDDTIKAFNMAKEIGFESINMDLIIGLPGENVENVKNSIQKVIELNPDNITVHALAYKKGSQLMNKSKCLSKDYEIVEQMYEITKENCFKAGYFPYYMYRQKNIKANLENIGYCLEGKESIYNIVIIEEVETILACGAGAVSKILKGNNRHERVQNYKSLEEYMLYINKNIHEKNHVLSV